VCVFSEPGAASAVARALEAENLAGLVGTVAGDDTVFVAVESAPEGAALMARVLFLSPTD
jgi:arginine repressor